MISEFIIGFFVNHITVNNCILSLIQIILLQYFINNIFIIFNGNVIYKGKSFEY